MISLRYLGTIALACSAIALQACQPQSDESTKKNQDEPTKPQLAAVIENAEITPESIEKSAKQIDETGFMQHLNTLTSDEFEGRAPSTPRRQENSQLH